MKEIKAVYWVTLRWRCPPCGRKRQASGKGMERGKDAAQKKVCKCGCPGPQVTEDYLVWIKPE